MFYKDDPLLSQGSLGMIDRYTCCVLNPYIGGNKSAVCSPRPFAMRLWDVL